MIQRAEDLPAHAPPDVILPGVLVQIIDQGPGISPQDMDQIFVPFFRSNWATQQQLGGTGLGLIVARRLIELHRGSLWAEASSTAAPGGHFLFTLPTAE